MDVVHSFYVRRLRLTNPEEDVKLFVGTTEEVYWRLDGTECRRIIPRIAGYYVWNFTKNVHENMSIVGLQHDGWSVEDIKAFWRSMKTVVWDK